MKRRDVAAYLPTGTIWLIFQQEREQFIEYDYLLLAASFCFQTFWSITKTEIVSKAVNRLGLLTFRIGCIDLNLSKGFIN